MKLPIANHKSNTDILLYYILQVLLHRTQLLSLKVIFLNFYLNLYYLKLWPINTYTVIVYIAVIIINSLNYQINICLTFINF